MLDSGNGREVPFEESEADRKFREIASTGHELLKTGKKTLPVALEVSDLAELGQTAARLTLLAEDLIDTERERHRNANDEIKGVRARAQDVSRKIATGTDDRPVGVRIYAHFPTNVIRLYRVDSGALVHEEAMSAELRQLMLTNDIEARLRDGRGLPNVDLRALQVIIDRPEEEKGKQQSFPLEKSPRMEDMPPITDDERRHIRAGRIYDALASYKARTGIKAKFAKLRLQHDCPWDTELPPEAPEKDEQKDEPQGEQPGPAVDSSFTLDNNGERVRRRVDRDGIVRWIGVSFGALVKGAVFVVDGKPGVYESVADPVMGTDRGADGGYTWAMRVQLATVDGPDDAPMTDEGNVVEERDVDVDIEQDTDTDTDAGNSDDDATISDPPTHDLRELAEGPAKADEPQSVPSDYDEATPALDADEIHLVVSGSDISAMAKYRERTGKDLRTARRAVKRYRATLD
jgi:hypothetical protein